MLLEMRELQPRFFERQKIGIGILPEGEERQIRLSSVGTTTACCERPSESEMRQWIEWRVDQFASMIDDGPELGGRLGVASKLELRLSAKVRRPEFRHLRVIKPSNRLEQFE